MQTLSPLHLLSNPFQGGELLPADRSNIVGSQLGGPCTLTGSAVQQLLALSTGQLALLRRSIWESIQQGTAPRVDTSYIDRALSRTEPSFFEKSVDLLRCIRRRTKILGSAVTLFDLNAPDRLEAEAATILCIDTGHNNDNFDRVVIKFHIDYLTSKGFVQIPVRQLDDFMRIGLTPSGLIYLEEQSIKKSSSTQGFVAMWFNEETETAWEDGIEPAIRDAGYRAFRIDKHHHETRIDDEIIAQIRQSKFLLADFTCGRVPLSDGSASVPVTRGGVFFEAGFAAGLNLPVIWTVRADSFDGLHFDTRQYPHIIWNDPQKLRLDLKDRVIALLGKGPLNP